MTFWLSKLVQALLLPSNCLVLLLVIGLVALVLGRRTLAVRVFATATVLIALVGWSPLAPRLVMILEDRFPQPDLPQSVAGIVMLGGATDMHLTQERGQVALNDNAERVSAVAVLARQFPDARIILSGGVAHAVQSDLPSEAEGARRVLVDLGVAANRIELEERSRTTIENAAESFALAKPQSGQSWLLVTSAFHMPRAVASFRAVGFPIIPYPVDYRTGPGDLRSPASTVAEGFEDMDIAAHEWLGLLGYRLTGKTAEILPAAE